MHTDKEREENWQRMVRLLRDPKCQGRYDLMADAASMIERLVGYLDSYARSAITPINKAGESFPGQIEMQQYIDRLETENRELRTARSSVPAIKSIDPFNENHWVLQCSDGSVMSDLYDDRDYAERAAQRQIGCKVVPVVLSAWSAREAIKP